MIEMNGRHKIPQVTSLMLCGFYTVQFIKECVKNAMSYDYNLVQKYN